MPPCLHAATQASTINERASSVSHSQIPSGARCAPGCKARGLPAASPARASAAASSGSCPRSGLRIRALHDDRRPPGAGARGAEGHPVGDPRERGALPRSPGQPGGPHPAPRRGRLPHLRQPGLLPGVRHRAQRRARAPLRAPRARRRQGDPAGARRRTAPAALRRRRSRPPAARAGSSGRSMPFPAARAGDPRGAMPRPRHHRAAPRRGRADGGAQAGGGRQPRQVAFPRRHEPRDPHADERHPRHDLAARRHRAVARAAHLRPRHRALGAHAADA